MLLWLLSWAMTVLLGVLVLAWVWKELTLGMCKSKKQLHGKTVIVTGGNAGIGYETAKDLARRGARIVLACRSKERGLLAVQTIMAETGNKNVELKILDLTSFESVKSFAEDITSTLDKVDILVNNAGIPPLPGPRLSKDKLDIVLQTNHFSHFLLTSLLKDLLLKSESPRIVNVSSMASKFMNAPIDYSSIKRGVEYKIEAVYAVSKFMNCLYSKELVRRWGHLGVQSYSLHPGAVRTEIFSKMTSPPWYDLLHPQLQALLRTLLKIIGAVYGKTSFQGAQTSLHCCLEDGLKNGEYYSDCRVGARHVTNPDINKPDLAAQLWEFSEKLVQN